MRLNQGDNMAKQSKVRVNPVRKEVVKDQGKDKKNTKVTFECSFDDRIYIKMLAAKEEMTISEFILSYLRPVFPRIPNAETIAALEESEQDRKDGKLKGYDNFDDMWNDLMSDDA